MTTEKTTISPPAEWSDLFCRIIEHDDYVDFICGSKEESEWSEELLQWFRKCASNYKQAPIHLHPMQGTDVLRADLKSFFEGDKTRCSKVEIINALNNDRIDQ